MKRWKVDAGNSSTGQVGFVIYDIEAETAEAALEQVRMGLPDYLEQRVLPGKGSGWMVVTYFNTDALTLDNIEEDDDEEDDTEYECDNCSKRWTEAELRPAANLSERMDEDGDEPDGECPECGALCYAVEDEAEVKP